ncbi:MAG: class I SAM-dependent methyltransferase [Angustibacter sp.]
MPGEATIWDAGHYPALAQRLEPAAVSLAQIAGPGRGRFALDVAAGTGSVARRLAGAGWHTSATDLSPRMVELGRAASEAGGNAIAWQVAELADQPVEDASQDLVASSFGLIFAADPRLAVAEVARVLAPAGRLLFTAWAEDGYMAEMTRVMRPFVESRAGASGPLDWGSEPFLREVLALRFVDVEIGRRSLPWSFPSAREGREWLERVSPAHIAAMAAAGERAEAMMDAVQAHLDRFGTANGVSVEAEYLVAEARRIP